MAEAAAAAAITTPAPTATPAPTPSAGTQVAPDHWASSFKNEEIRSYVQQKGFKTTEDLATSFFNLEKMKGVPEDKLIRLPDKMEGDAARAVYERLGMPKEAKEYALPRDDKSPDPKFAEWAEGVFHKNGISKSQAESLAKAYSDRGAEIAKEWQTNRDTARKQADDTLKKEWGAKYDENVNTVRQGAKVLGLDQQTLDILETVQGREKLYKNLQKIGVSVAEDKFVDGGGNQTNTGMSAEEAKQKLQALQNDRKFLKRFSRGDVDAVNEIQNLNKIIAPGDFSVR